MKSKGAIQAFSIALALSCLFYMSFSLVTWMVENDADEFATKGKNPEEITQLKERYLDSISDEEVYNLVVTSYTYSECRRHRLNLGLDLQGGMHVTLEIAVDELIKRLSSDDQSITLRAALAKANEMQKESQTNYVDLFYQAYKEKAAPDESLFRAFDSNENRDKFDRTADAEDRDLQVLEFIKDETSQAVQRTTDILRTRIDMFGVTQPTIREEGSGRITIELPGVNDAQRVRDLLQRSAKLEFWETYEAADLVQNYFPAVNEVLVNKLGLNTPDSTSNDSTGTDSLASVTDDPIAALTSSIEEDTLGVDSANSEAVDPVAALTGGDSNVSDTGELDSVALAKAQKEAFAKVPLYQKLQPPVDQQSGNVAQGPIAGFARSVDRDIIMEYLNYPEVKEVLPSDMKFIWEKKPTDPTSKVYRLIVVKTEPNGEAPLEGSVITDASQEYDQIQGTPQVSMRMNPTGARLWREITERNVGKSVAISLDNLIYSYPTVNGAIPNGSSVIQGNFTIEEAKDLASVLKAGKLPITVNIAEEETVGPTLGKESISNGMNSLIGGFALVLLFMALYYNKSGWVANIALLANLFFIVGILASLQAALTLPGMAGIVLTIGMSVDANVLIFERIREELKAGKSVKQAVSDGYKNAYSSIIDANLTTLLTGFILLFFGKGPISGFAVILVIGILTSLFCAIFITRLIFVRMLEREQNIKFGTEKSMRLFDGFKIDFIGKRKIAYTVSGIVIAIGLVSLFTKGLNLSVDFEGGRSYVVAFDEARPTDDVRSTLSEVFGSTPEVKTFGSTSTHKVTTKYKIDDKGEGADDEVQEKLIEGLTSVAGEGKFKILKSQKVGPTFARDIEISAIWSIVVGLIAIFFYIIARFRKWQYGLGALLALFHDVLIVLSLFSIFSGLVPFLEVDQAFIAAILTVVGYSINDTVVVFDRIRESLGIHTKAPLKETINDALNKTVSRTFITSITTLLVIVMLFIFGGEIIRGFSFALLIGVLVGTYSSLFIATPVVVDFDKSGR